MAKKSASLNVGTTLFIENAGQLKAEFDKAIINSETIRIKSGKITQVDLTGVQLLHYFISRSKTEGKKLVLNLNINEDQQNMLIKSGFAELIETIIK